METTTKKPKRRRRKRKAVKSEESATLSVKESMAVTGIGSVRTYEMLRKGIIPSIMVGRKFFIPKTALMRWLDSCGKER